MQIENLQIELRPRTNAQALDLGFALLRSHASAAYLAFFALWLPVIALCAGLAIVFPDVGGGAWILLAWWFKPLLERAPLYVLSRQVFGTAVTWQEALRAWPRQLGGGWFRLLTWGRPIAAGRSLYQPVWQLEHARGKVASARMRVLGKQGTGQSAFWFGVVCAHLESVLQLGLLGFIGIFVSDSEFTNPFAAALGTDGLSQSLMMLGLYGLAAGIMAPIYTACGFTLYLNRRASLEAWDLEIQLRQIRPPAAARPRARVPTALGVLATLLLAVSVALPPDASAAAQATCKAPDVPKDQRPRGADNSAQQARVRKMVDQVYAREELRGYQCVENWQPKHRAPEKKKEQVKPTAPPSLALLASIVKVLLIALAIGAVGWLLYRYRDKFPAFAARPRAVAATEIGGLDIRAESLPPNVGAEVRALWAGGQRRAALALLYRATLSRLVSEDGLLLCKGDTEGDCLRLAQAARQDQRLAQARLDVAAGATSLWLNAAYGDRWPEEAALLAACSAWQAQFGTTRERAA
jgi:hypothetical protein